MTIKRIIRRIEKQIGENIHSYKLMSTTDCSRVYEIRSKHQSYVLKLGKHGENMHKDFMNHSMVYKSWLNKRNYLNFNIPEPFFSDIKENFYVMKYVERSKNIQSILHDDILKDFTKLIDIFSRSGMALKEYHNLFPREMSFKKSFCRFDSNRLKEAETYEKNEITSLYESLPKDDFCYIHADFKPMNVLIDNKNRIWIIDFKEIFYFGSPYMDVARFIDSAKIFTFLHSPFTYLKKRMLLNELLTHFLYNYDCNLNLKSLLASLKCNKYLYIKSKKKWQSGIIKHIYNLL